MSNLFRTDLAIELEKSQICSDGEKIQISQVYIDSKKAELYGRAEGKYISIESKAVSNGELSLYSKIEHAIEDTLLSYEKRVGKQKVLVVGLGNADMTADALGPLVVNGLDISDRICGILPSVQGKTGIESYDIIKGVVDRVKPTLVIAIDSLAAAAVDRVCNVFQFSNGGITPGSGVANHRMRISTESIGVPVISVGVPLVVYASTIVRDSGGDGGSSYLHSLIVTPKDIDLLVRDCAGIISSGINRAYS